MSMIFEGATVTIDEIAKVMRAKPDAVAAEAKTLGLHVGEDWAGRPAVSPVDARALASDDARREREREKAAMSTRVACEEWVRRRVEHVNAAYSEAVREAHRAGKGGGSAQQGAREVANEAGRHYERTVPRPDPKAEHLAFIGEEEAAQKGVGSRFREMIKR